MEPQSTHAGPRSDSIHGPLNQAIDSASAGAHALIDGASSAAQPTVSKLAREAHELVNRLASAANVGSASLLEGETRLQGARDRMATSYRSAVGSNPVAAVGIALAAGFVLSRLLSRR